jgi:alpha-glucan,water dikinase
VLRKLQKWGDYESFGTPVWPSRFVPMKTPLSHDILRDWKLLEAPHHSLTVQDLLAAQAAAGRQVGLIIDLTNHDCLYEEDVPAEVGVPIHYSTRLGQVSSRQHPTLVHPTTCAPAPC